MVRKQLRGESLDTSPIDPTHAESKNSVTGLSQYRSKRELGRYPSFICKGELFEPF